MSNIIHLYQPKPLKISILVPCWNEEKSIEKNILSCLNQTVKPHQIVVVDDSSTDGSSEILAKYQDQITVVKTPQRLGNKSYAQEYGLQFITGDAFVTTDGDTVLDKDFVKRIAEDFQDPEVAAVSGYVRSLKHNWLTAYRAYEYVIGQNIHKLAQSSLNYIFVLPGAASAFRTEIFKKYISFDHDTVTEDLDFTYKLHKNNLKIKYDRQAVVFTQDPSDIHSYIKQIRRWYGGGGQNLVKHLNRDLVDDPRRVFELSLIYIDGLVFSFLLWLLPIINLNLALRYFYVMFLFIALQAAYAIIKEKRPDLILTPVFVSFLMFVNSAIFIEQFFKEVIFRKKSLVWLSAERVKI